MMGANELERRRGFGLRRNKSMDNTQQRLESDELDTLLAEAWPQLSRETQRRLMVYATRTSTRQSARKQSWPARLLAKTLGRRRDATAERAIDELKNRIAATAEKEQVLDGLSRSLREMATGDVRPIEDVIREAKHAQVHH
jgi:hypothetical protein